MTRPTLPTTYVRGQGAHRDDHEDIATICNGAQLASENFGGDSAPASLSTARTNLGLGSSSTSDLASTTPVATAAAGSVGVGTTVARADHVHASPQLTSSTPAATAASGSVGAGTTSARSDHVHASPQLSSATPAALGSAGAGAGTASSRDDHVHPTTGLLLTSALSSSTPAAVANAGSAGASSNVSRADHAHGLERTIQIKVMDDSTMLTTGDGKIIFCIPSDIGGWNLVDADAFVTTVSSSGLPTIQIRNVTQAADMLTTRITIDASEFTSYTAATAPVIDNSNKDVATGDLIAVDVDVAGTGAKGLGVILRFGA